MALLTAQAPTASGITPTYSTPTASDTVAYNAGDNLLLIVRTTSNSDNVGIVTPGNVDGWAITDATWAMSTSSERMILLTPVFVDPSTGLITITHGTTTGVTVAVVRMP